MKGVVLLHECTTGFLLRGPPTPMKRPSNDTDEEVNMRILSYLYIYYSAYLNGGYGCDI